MLPQRAQSDAGTESGPAGSYFPFHSKRRSERENAYADDLMCATSGHVVTWREFPTPGPAGVGLRQSLRLKVSYEIQFSCEKDKKLKGNSVLLSRFIKMNAVVASVGCMFVWTLTVCPSFSMFVYLRVLNGVPASVSWRGKAFFQVHPLLSGINTKDILLPLAFLSCPLSFALCPASITPEKLIDSERKRSSGCSRRYNNIKVGRFYCTATQIQTVGECLSWDSSAIPRPFFFVCLFIFCLHII